MFPSSGANVPARPWQNSLGIVINQKERMADYDEPRTHWRAPGQALRWGGGRDASAPLRSSRSP
eukprot:gene9193-biopygen3698